MTLVGQIQRTKIDADERTAGFLIHFEPCLAAHIGSVGDCNV